MKRPIQTTSFYLACVTALVILCVGITRDNTNDLITACALYLMAICNRLDRSPL